MTGRTDRRQLPPFECGGVLMIIFVLTLVALGALVYLGLYPVIYKKMAATLRVETEALCAEIVNETLLAQEAEERFFGGLANVQQKVAEQGGRITRAVLFFNEMSSDSNQPYSKIYFSREIDSAGLPGPGQDTATNESSLPSFTPANIPSGTPCGSGVECYSHGRLGFNDSRVIYGPESDPVGVGTPDEVPVPRSLVLRSYYSGNLIGCEITADIGGGSAFNFFGDTFLEKAVARIVYHQVPGNLNDEYFDPGSVINGTDFNPTQPKLTVIIDPYLQTDNANEARHTPHPSLVGAQIPVDPVNSTNFFSANYPNDVDFENNIDFNEDGIRNESSFRYPITAPTGAELQEKIRACYNMPSLVRNGFLYWLFSYLVRDGFFRGNTFVLMTNPKHRVYFEDNPAVVADPTIAHEYHPGLPNAPSLIFTGDLLAQTAEIPFLNFFGPMLPLTEGTTIGEQANFDPSLAGERDHYLTPPLYLDPDLDGTLDAYPMGSPLRDGPPNPPGNTMLTDNKFSQGFTQPFWDGVAQNNLPFNGRRQQILQPTYDIAALNPDNQRPLEQIEYHSIVAGQLRDCFGMFRPGGNGISIDHSWDQTLLHQYDKEAIIGIRPPPSGLTYLTPAGAGTTHDSYWARTYASGQPVVPGNNNIQQRLNIFQFVSMLGAGQSCPRAVKGSTITGGVAAGDPTDPGIPGPGPFCYKPANTISPLSGVRAGDLRGDVFSALAHIAREPVQLFYDVDNTFISETTTTESLPAITRPGLFYQDSEFCLDEEGGGACTPITLPDTFPQNAITALAAPYNKGLGEYFGKSIGVSDLLNCNDFALDGGGNCDDLYTTASRLNQDQLANPPKGDHYIIIVTHQPPLAGEVALWRRYLTGVWSDLGGNQWRINNLTDQPLWESLYNEHIAVVHIDAYSNSHAEADAAYSLWSQSLVGVAGDTAQILDGGGSPVNGNFFNARRKIMMMSPWGEQMYADDCSSSNRPESCDYGDLVGGAYSSDQAYQDYYGHLLFGEFGGGGNPVNSPANSFGGTVRERARALVEWMKQLRRLF